MTTQNPKGKALLLHSVDLSHRFSHDTNMRRDDGCALYRCSKCGLVAVQIRATGMLRRSEPSGPCEGATVTPFLVRPVGCTCLGLCRCSTSKVTPPQPQADAMFLILSARCDGSEDAEGALTWIHRERHRHLDAIARYEAELLAWEKATGRSTP